MDLISFDLAKAAVDPKLEITEKDIDDALDSLIYSKYSQHGWDEKKMYSDKMQKHHHWTAYADQFRPQAEINAREHKKKQYEREIQTKKKEMRRFTNLENPNAPLCVIDIMELKLPYFDRSITEQGIKELNIEIFKRIVRERLPHKFA
jgi:hypothetical protein